MAAIVGLPALRHSLPALMQIKGKLHQDTHLSAWWRRTE
jgi:hypothetical protein